MDEIVSRLFLILLLIGINAFFVTAEFSIIAVRRSRINQLVEAGDRPARSVQFLQRRLDRLLSTTQLGITLASLTLGWLGENTLALIFQKFFSGPGSLAPGLTVLTHGLAIPITFVAIAYLQIVLGELCPKSWALLYAEQLSRALAPLIQGIARVISPFLGILNYSTQVLLRLGGAEISHHRWAQRLTPEELQLIISTEGESSGLNSHERTLLKNLFSLGNSLAQSIMVPRSQLVVLPETATLQDLLAAITQTGHACFPVKGESLDDIQGVIDFHDLAKPLHQGQLSPTSPLRAWVKPVRFFPETTPLTELLVTMQQTQLKAVIIVDEFGGTAGLVTLEDLMTEIVGDESAEEGDNPLLLQRLDAQTLLVEARITVAEANKILGLQLPLTDEYQTLGGFLLYTWQRIPNPGESLEYGPLTFTVVTASGPKLETIRIHRSLVSRVTKAPTSLESPSTSLASAPIS
ncbi:hemolysin family protein [Synechocystis sp. LKSZ1]|uniref:hemolysin family protein n=1 Tax=Synechocystis sp. LKSZ1 TaxID=3144951 RepID=UPI00336BFB8F